MPTCRILILFLLTYLAAGAQIVIGQTEEMAVVDRIEELQKQLDAADVGEQDAAEQELIKTGQIVLDQLADPGPEFSSQKNERLMRVRKTLEQEAIKLAISAGRVTIGEPMSLLEALAKIKQQTGNVVELPPGLDDSVGAKPVDVDLADATFWEAMNAILPQVGCRIDEYGGEPGKLAIVPKSDEVNAVAANLPTVPRGVAGIFDVSVGSVVSVRNLESPSLDHTTVNLQIRWEPRLSPISIEMPGSELKIVDEFDQAVAMTRPETVLSGIVQPQISQLEFSVPLKRIARDVDEIKTMTGRIEAVLPGRKETFRFPPFATIDKPRKISRAGVNVICRQWQRNEDLYGVTLTVGFDESAGPVESHLNWLYDNEVHLEDEAGELSDPVAYEAIGTNEEGLTIEYFFLTDPSKCRLVYKSPGAIARIPVTFTIKNIQLP